ncbi:ribonuclease H-like domain-containing protein [Candidatus Woesearchaeota archaeon]|nr:ribonuclease H-like domain-containing protein [Candidatus Woesearchaeota archaeon]
MAKGERIEDILKGRRTTCEGIEYYRVKTFIEDLRIPITEYLEAHIADWQTGRIKSRQNQDFYIPLDKVGFYDIENRGLSHNHQIFLNGLLYFNGKKKLVYDGLFARDSLEEKAILKAFLKRAKSLEGLITFNGAFDLSRTKERLREPHVTYWLWPEEKHLDVRHAISPYNNIHGLKESTLISYEIALFNFKRPADDVSGAEIPKAYTRYLNGGNPEPLARVVKHNILDLITTAAIYVWLLKNPEYFNRNLIANLKF